MARPVKPYFDEDGNFIIRPYRLKDLSAVYGVSTRTVRRWLDCKLPDEGRKTNMFFTIDQVTKIVNVLGLPHKISVVATMQQFKQAV